MQHEIRGSRRAFLGSMAAASTVLATGQGGTAGLARAEEPNQPAGPNDRLRIATIGMGIIGFIDTECALRVPGVELVAACDLYEGRRTHAKEVFGDRVDVTGDYRAILDRKDIDAVLICVPDFWHATMAIDAMKAGKAVYCEKPMVRLVGEGPDIIAAQKATGAVFQVGSQFASSVLYSKAKEMIGRGMIGAVNAVEARFNRNTALGAWQYSIPTDASPQTVDWDRFLAAADRKVPFDLVRFFRWRNYSEYGTAVAGDLFVHLLTGIHVALDSQGPDRVSAMGATRYWKDGRDVNDVIMALLNYPATAAHPGFTLSLQSNFEDGGGDDSHFRFVGSEGVISVDWTSLKLTRKGIENPTPEQVFKGYNSVNTFANAEQKAFAEKYLSENHPQPSTPRADEVFHVPPGYDARLDHFANFFAAVRKQKPVVEDAEFGLRAAAPALLCNESSRDGRVIRWDPIAMKIVS